MARRFAPRSAARRIAAALTLVLAAPVACAERADHAPAPEAATPRRGGTLVIAGGNDLELMNSLVSTEAWTQELLASALFMPLIRYGPDLDFEPYLAERWEMLGDTGVVFHLRRDVKWHDGVPTTAYDVLFTYERARDPRTASSIAHYFEHWYRAEVLDSFTIRFHFRPHGDPLASWPFAPIMPRHLLDSIPPERLRQAAFNKAPVGNGPFRFVSFQANDRWVFAANRDFPEDLGGPPYIDRVVWRVIPDNNAQVAELLAGTADLILGPRANQVDDLDARPGIRVIQRPARRYVFIGWNGADSRFADARVRRALSMAIDRNRLIANRAGYGELAAGPISPHHWAYDSSVAPLPYDTAAARALLAEAGFLDRDGDGILEGPDGRDFTFTLKIAAGNTFQRDMAELIRTDLAAIGVPIVARPVEFNTLISEIANVPRNFEAVIMGWSADFRINLHEMFHTSALGGQFQLASYSNPELDSLLDHAASTVDRDAARPLWRRVQEILRDEQPWTFLYYYPDLYAIRERVQGVEMDIRGAFTNLPRWWLADAESSVASGRSP
ncbi:MAG TPA: ABC transporter substrate-binding protein [Longimicrobiales bacterium]